MALMTILLLFGILLFPDHPELFTTEHLMKLPLEWPLIVLALLVLLAIGSVNTAVGQELYKYRGADGEWIYADRPPEDGETVEKRELESHRVMPEVTVTHQVVGRVVRLKANNQFYVPVELVLDIREISGLEYPDPDPDQELRWMLPPRSDTTLVSLNSLENGDAPFIQFQFTYLPGDPEAEHRPTEPYRVPFAIANDYRVMVVV